MFQTAMHRHQGLAVGQTIAWKGGSSKTTSTSTNIMYSPEEAANRAQVMDEAENIYAATAPQMTAAGYPGAAPVGVTADTYAGQALTKLGAQSIMGDMAQTQAAGQMAGNAVQQQGQLANYQNGVMAGGVNYGLNGAMDVQNNPYLRSAMQAAINPITENYTDPGGVMGTIRTNAAQSGQYGGSRQGIAEGIAAGRYAREIGDVTAKMGTAAYDTGQKTFASTLGLVPDWLKAGTGNAQLSLDYQKNQGQNLQGLVTAAQAPGAMYSGVGAQNENIAREWADYAANQRMWELNAPWMPLQNYANIVYGGSTPSTTSTSTAAGGSRNALGQVVGTGLTAASLYSMMGS